MPALRKVPGRTKERRRGPAASDEGLAQPSLKEAALTSRRLVGPLGGVGVSRLQRVLGNAALGKLLNNGRAFPARVAIQRYAVDMSATADCGTLLDWLNTSNPYSGEGAWAKTHVRFTWTGGIRITGSAPDFRATIQKPRVTKTARVDMPQWRARDTAMRAAWSSMYATLRAHEGEHEAIGERWKTELLKRLRALNLEVTADNRAQATRQAQEMVNAEWDSWLAEHQSEQSSIDPFTTELVCPPEG